MVVRRNCRSNKNPQKKFLRSENDQLSIKETYTFLAKSYTLPAKPEKEESHINDVTQIVFF